jgi:hypothetical protein
MRTPAPRYITWLCVKASANWDVAIIESLCFQWGYSVTCQEGTSKKDLPYKKKKLIHGVAISNLACIRVKYRFSVFYKTKSDPEDSSVSPPSGDCHPAVCNSRYNRLNVRKFQYRQMQGPRESTGDPGGRLEGHFKTWTERGGGFRFFFWWALISSDVNELCKSTK